MDHQGSRRPRGATTPAIVVATALLAAACGGDGGTEPEPPRPNRAPVAAGSIPAQTVAVGESVSVSVASAFSDPDGDALTYAAASSASGVATVAVSGASVSVTGVSIGAATITVTARDAGGLSAQQTFEVTVPNRAPVVTDSIPVQTVQAGESVSLDLAMHFSDPDGDALTYTAETSAPHIASVAVSGASLTVIGVFRGTATITATARDAGGLSAQQAIEVTVPNRAPVVTDGIPAQTMQATRSVTLDLAEHFGDPEGDTLTYTAETSAPGVASAAVSGAELIIAGASAGTATITVAATDPGGLIAAQTFQATIIPPAPDLTFADVSPASATLTPGGSVTFTFTVRNRGAAPSPATTIRAMRSANPGISTRDAELASYSFAELGADEERAFPLTISANAGSAPGTIFIGMCVDPVAEEPDTRNNCSGGARLTIAASSSGLGRAAVERSAIRVRAHGPPTEEPDEHTPRDWTR